MTTDYVIPESRNWLGRQELDEDVWSAALARTRRVYDEFDHVFVSFSGGKDSTCVLHVALEVARERGELPLRVVFFDEECISYETEDYVRRVAARPDVELEWYCLPLRQRNACTQEEPFWWSWAAEVRDIWVRPLPLEAITGIPGFPAEPKGARLNIPHTTRLLAPYSKYGRSAVLLGIRAQESMTRLRAVSNRRQDNWLIPITRALFKAYPIYDWRTEDVWTMPARQGWDYNASYDVMEMAGMSHAMQRCAPPFAEEPLQNLWHWARCFPDVWERMAERVPGAGAAVRYAKTEIYGFGPVSRPDDETWQETIRALIAKHPPEIGAAIARALKSAIERHYRRTSDPILGRSPHPITGLSWEALAKIARRGDMRNRRTTTLHVRVDGRKEQAQRNYDRELAEWRARA